jgi:mRNA interferase RelE/StbE
VREPIAAQIGDLEDLYLAERIADRVDRGVEDTVLLDDLTREVDGERQMRWCVEFAASAARSLRELDPPTARRILRFLNERVAPSADPRALGRALQASELGAFWKYRVGDYRIVARIGDSAVRSLVVRLGHRTDICR